MAVSGIREMLTEQFGWQTNSLSVKSWTEKLADWD